MSAYDEDYDGSDYDDHDPLPFQPVTDNPRVRHSKHRADKKSWHAGWFDKLAKGMAYVQGMSRLSEDVEYGYVWDTRDPYVLRDECIEAQKLLEKHFVSGALSTNRDANHDEAERVNAEAPYSPTAYGWCAMGAVMAVQGHATENCNLIRALNGTATSEYGHEFAYQVNDGYGQNSTIALFETTCAKFAEEIRLAEDYASAYPDFGSYPGYMRDTLAENIKGLLESGPKIDARESV